MPRPRSLDLTDQSRVSNLKRVDRRLPSATDYLLGIKRASNTVAGKYAHCSVTVLLYDVALSESWGSAGADLARDDVSLSRVTICMSGSSG